MLQRNISIGPSQNASGLFMERPQVSVVLLLLLTFFGMAKMSRAQAIPVAEKNGGINIFGGYTFTTPDYGRQDDNGFFVSGNFVLRRFIFGQPALAARYSRVTGSTTNETFAGAGLESLYRIGPVRPYITALYGVGGVNVSSAHYSDSGNEFLLGGGAEVPLAHRFGVRAEYTYGWLNLSGTNGTAHGAIDLNPASVNIGAVYHLW
jgi:hypothetical protein